MDKAFALTSKARKENPNSNIDKPCIYVGQSSKKPEERFYEHMNGIRNKKGPLFSRIVHKYGIRLRPRLYQKYNPMTNQSEALEKEKELTEKYRRRGYTVWSR
ncbi:GIY-YIG nuclease family protein [Chloroflexota bacterium]